MPRAPISTLFPYTTLFRSQVFRMGRIECTQPGRSFQLLVLFFVLSLALIVFRSEACVWCNWKDKAHCSTEDRKSTRLNSSHPSISYAVFCLKKKNLKKTVN